MDDVSTLPARRRLTVLDYHRMGEAGILGVGARVELIEGELIDMAPIGQEHAGVVNRVVEALFLACVGRAIVSVQNPVRLDLENEPQPDVAVFRRRADFYAEGERPGAADVLLLVEVADSSLRYDRAVKLPLYARAGIAEVWLVDLKARVLEAHRSPLDGGYAEVTAYGPCDALSLVLMPEVVVRLDLVFLGA